MLIHPVAMVTILGEFLADSRTSLFPMIHLFQMEEERSNHFGERFFRHSHTIKTNICSNPLGVSHVFLHILLWLAADTVSPV